MAGSEPLIEYRLWGRIEPLASEGYLAIASTLREDLEPTGTRVVSEIHPTREAAELALRSLMTRLGEDIRREGGRIVDVETDGVLSASIAACTHRHRPAPQENSRHEFQHRGPLSADDSILSKNGVSGNPGAIHY